MESTRYILYRGLFACFCTILFPMLAHGQNVCINQTLQRIVEQIPELPVSSSSEEEELVLSRVNGKCPIVVSRNAEGSINHVGFKLFNRKIMEKHASPLYTFIERYVLELSLLSEQEISTRLKMDRVRITSEIYPLSPSVKDGLRHILSDDIGHSSLYISNNSNRYTVSLLKKEKQLLQISFPVRHELITGFTKLEAESSFYPSLLAHLNVSDSSLTEVELIPYKDNLYCTFEDSYIMDKFVSTAYYYKAEADYRPVFSPAYPAESLYNLFNALNHNKEMKVNVSQSLYGKNLDYEIPINRLTSFLRKQNCCIYTGLREADGSTISGTVMAVNMELGYQHLIVFSADKEILVHPDEHVIRAKMYCYIPIHNISTLFEY